MTFISDKRAPVAQARTEERPVGFLALDSKTLPRLLEARGYDPPRTFKALVIRVAAERDGSFSYQPYDYRGTANDRDNWWPASTVKLYAAIAALERARAWGFTPKAEVTFHYDADPVTMRLDEIVKRALVISDNRAYDRLVEIVGFTRINRRFFTAENGLPRTVLLRSYAHRRTNPKTGKGCNRHSPRITFKGRRRAKTIAERYGRTRFDCHDQGNCTTLAELAEAMRRVVMHETLPEAERFALGEPELRLLRGALSEFRPNARGLQVVNGLKEAFGERPLELFHKPGYANSWFSDNVFVHATDTDERWIVALANHPGRDSLDEATRHIGAILAKSELAETEK